MKWSNKFLVARVMRYNMYFFLRYHDGSASEIEPLNQIIKNAGNSDFEKSRSQKSSQSVDESMTNFLVTPFI